jgi:hypothetical protein
MKEGSALGKVLKIIEDEWIIMVLRFQRSS